MIGADHLPEMVVHLVGRQTEFAEADQIVADAIDPDVGERDAHRPLESVHPAQERQAERAMSNAAEFFVDVAFLPAEAAEVGMEAEPRGAPACEQAEALHCDLERWPIGVRTSGIVTPDAEEAR